MEQKSDRLYPSAPFKKDDLEQRLEKKLKDVNSFNNSINSIKEMITYFKDKNNKSKTKHKKHKMLTTKLKSFHTIVVIAKTSSSITLWLTGIGLIVILKPTGIAFGLIVSKKVIYEIIKQKNNKYKKQY